MAHERHFPRDRAGVRVLESIIKFVIMRDFKIEIDARIKLVNAELERRMPGEDIRPAVLHKAMRYSVFAGGKRLRPLLCLAACEAAGGALEAALLPAIALEALHTYTLIHDDLPAMDDDELRRGKPTSHVVFGEAIAILAGDALLALAFEWLGMCVAPAPYQPNQLTLELARASGSLGVVGGQVEDVVSEGARPDADLVEYIHFHKTAALLGAAVRMGGIAAGVSSSGLEALSSYGSKIGMAFQIIDDILNETSSPEQLGKAAGTDRARGKITYVAVHGLAAAQAAAGRLSREALDAARGLSGDVATLLFMADLMMKRTH